jgi:dTMP kinase
MLILLEGPEGAGKTTNAERLKDHLRQAGEDALYTREPGGNPVSEAVRGVLLDPKYAGEMEPLAEFFMFQASRVQFVNRVLRPALAAGQTVILDRYALSTIAYQIAGRGLPVAACLSAIDLATGGLVPDLTFLLMASYETGRARQKEQKKRPDRMEAEVREFHERVIDGYRAFSKVLPTWNIHTIETDGLPPDGVFYRMLEILRVEHGVIS